MRGDDIHQDAMFSYLSPEARVPKDHPLRPLRQMVNQALRELSPDFAAMYSREGRPSIPPEKLLRALLLQVLYTIRSERLLMEQLDYNLLFRWFVGLSMDDPVWDATTFTKNRDRLLEGEIADAFFREVLAEAEAAGLVSDEHFTVDGTVLEAWASQKSFRRRDTPADPPDDPGNPTINFRGEQRKNDTHRSTTDPDARLYKKSTGAEGKIDFLADGNGDFAKAIDLAFDGSGNGLGTRSKRYSMLVDDGVVKKLNIEDAPGKCDISGGQTLLGQL